jgi:uncharacterized membrane protein
MNINSVEPGEGVNWFSEGWRLFKLSPGAWLLILIVYIVIAVVLNMIPLLGKLASMIVGPALGAGLFRGARKLDEGGGLEVQDLFSGLTDEQRRVPLLTLGVIYVGLVIVVIMVAGALMFLSGGAAWMHSMQSGGFDMHMPFTGMLVTLLLSLAMLLVGAATYFAGPLVLLEGLEPLEAIKLGLRACVQNVVPMLVASVVFVVLGVIASIPAGLGWLVLLPVTFAAGYASYKSIFAN